MDPTTDAMTPLEAARIALRCLDLTSLNDADDAAAVEALCVRAQGRHGSVAAVCVWPRFVALARARLPAEVKVAAVANFPAGRLDADAALGDAGRIADTGGDEIDLVLPWRAFAAGQTQASAALVRAVRRALPRHTLKLIIESGGLGTPELIAAACRVGLDEGVDFLKTSTGKTAVSATPDAARTMLGCIAGHARGAAVGFKASGGIRSVADAGVYIALVQEALGAQALQPARLRFGASGLLADIEAVLDGAAPAAGADATTRY